MAIVNVIVPELAADWNVTSWNSGPARVANVSVCEVGEVKTTTPVPTAQLAEVLLLDHDPPKVQVPLPIRK